MDKKKTLAWIHNLAGDRHDGEDISISTVDVSAWLVITGNSRVFPSGSECFRFMAILTNERASYI
jgi:hypothetical protein